MILENGIKMNWSFKNNVELGGGGSSEICALKFWKGLIPVKTRIISEDIFASSVNNTVNAQYKKNQFLWYNVL